MSSSVTKTCILVANKERKQLNVDLRAVVALEKPYMPPGTSCCCGAGCSKGMGGSAEAAAIMLTPTCVADAPGTPTNSIMLALSWLLLLLWHQAAVS
jgi:hypothetical protein